MKADRTTLYRHYDEVGRLLYVGISFHSGIRQLNHRATKEWFDKVALTTHEKYANRGLALAAETAAIKTEHPLYNKTHSSLDTDGTQAAMRTQIWGAIGDFIAEFPNSEIAKRVNSFLIKQRARVLLAAAPTIIEALSGIPEGARNDIFWPPRVDATTDRQTNKIIASSIPNCG